LEHGCLLQSIFLRTRLPPLSSPTTYFSPPSP